MHYEHLLQQWSAQEGHYHMRHGAYGYSVSYWPLHSRHHHAGTSRAHEFTLMKLPLVQQIFLHQSAYPNHLSSHTLDRARLSPERNSQPQKINLS